MRGPGEGVDSRAVAADSSGLERQKYDDYQGRWHHPPGKYTVELMSEDTTMKVEVAYALPEKQAILEVEVAAGATVLEAAQQSGITEKFSGIDLENAKFGIFGNLVSSKQVLRAGDRVEIYRPLIADPKEVRKARAARARERREQDKAG